jgi:hypothetical protein
MLGLRLLDMRGSRRDVVGVYAGIEVNEGQSEKGDDMVVIGSFYPLMFHHFKTFFVIHSPSRA